MAICGSRGYVGMHTRPPRPQPGDSGPSVPAVRHGASGAPSLSLPAEAAAARDLRDWAAWIDEVDLGKVHRLELPTRGYRRHVFRDDPQAEVIACTWRAGEGTPLHGHGDSRGVTVVVEGSLMEERYVPQEGGGFRHEVRRMEPGSWNHHPLGIFHRVVGASASARSIQCTVPPLADPLAPVPKDVAPQLEDARTRALLKDLL